MKKRTITNAVVPIAISGSAKPDINGSAGTVPFSEWIRLVLKRIYVFNFNCIKKSNLKFLFTFLGESLKIVSKNCRVSLNVVCSQKPASEHLTIFHSGTFHYNINCRNIKFIRWLIKNFSPVLMNLSFILFEKSE